MREYDEHMHMTRIPSIADGKMNCFFGMHAHCSAMSLSRESVLFISQGCFKNLFLKRSTEVEIKFLRLSLILFDERLFQLLQTTDSKALTEQESLSLSKD